MYKYSVFNKNDHEEGRRTNSVKESLDFVKSLGKPITVKKKKIRTMLSAYGHVDINKDFILKTNDYKVIPVVVGNRKTGKIVEIHNLEEIKKRKCGFDLRTFENRIMKGDGGDFHIIPEEGKLVYQNRECGVSVYEVETPHWLELRVDLVGEGVYLERFTSISCEMIKGVVFIKFVNLRTIPRWILNFSVETQKICFWLVTRTWDVFPPGFFKRLGTKINFHYWRFRLKCGLV